MKNFLKKMSQMFISGVNMSYADKVRGKGLVLITGKKGSGKSHFATRILKDIVDSNNGKYQVFANITGLKLHSVQPAPDDWRDAPNNSIIFYDEAQLLPWADNSNTKISSDPRVANMTLIRKQNKHIVLMTQDPTFIHSALRKLVDYHYHLSHPFKDGKPHVFYFHGALSNFDDKGAWKNHVQEQFTYTLDKEISQLYESIEPDAVHDQKFKIPKKIIILRVAAFVFVLLAVILFFKFVIPLVFGFVKGIGGDDKPKQEQTVKQEKGVIQQTTDSVNTITGSQNQDQTQRIYANVGRLSNEKKEQYLNEFHTEFNYDDIRPTSVIKNGKNCMAFNRYGDRLNITPRQCTRLAMGEMPKARTQYQNAPNNSQQASQQEQAPQTPPTTADKPQGEPQPQEQPKEQEQPMKVTGGA